MLLLSNISWAINPEANLEVLGEMTFTSLVQLTILTCPCLGHGHQPTAHQWCGAGRFKTGPPRKSLILFFQIRFLLKCVIHESPFQIDASCSSVIYKCLPFRLALQSFFYIWPAELNWVASSSSYFFGVHQSFFGLRLFGPDWISRPLV